MKFVSCILISSQFVMFSPVMASTFKVVCDDKSKPFLLFFNSNLHSVEHEKLKKSIIKNISCPKGSKGRLLLSKNIKNSIYMKITVNKFPLPSHNRGGISFSLFLNSENVSYYYKKFPQLGASSFRQNLSGDISSGTAKLWEKLDAGPLLNGRNEEPSS